MSPFRLLDRFRSTFAGAPYRHRSSKLGDLIALELFEDLFEIGRSAAYNRRVREHQIAINSGNLRRGVRARRGDGTLGELVPNSEVVVDPGFALARGHVATIEIGVEVKILSKAMQKQQGRVASDIRDQAQHFRRKRDNPLCVAVIGINRAEKYVSYERAREWPTDGSNEYRHPIQEADSVEAYLRAELESELDDLVILRFRATNIAPFQFDWADPVAAANDYGAMLTRLARDYDTRFGSRQ